MNVLNMHEMNKQGKNMKLLIATKTGLKIRNHALCQCSKAIH